MLTLTTYKTILDALSSVFLQGMEKETHTRVVLAVCAHLPQVCTLTAQCFNQHALFTHEIKWLL